MKKILSSLTIIGLTFAVAIGFSGAFFSDTETSKANTLTAGKIDLLIDNTSYYNGVFNSDTTFAPSNLPGKYFFKFNDLKPGDYGEDTISLHVDDNDSWVCMKITKTADDDNTCTEPEKIDDPSCNDPDSDISDGELGKNILFMFWPDDGDNVLEVGENPAWRKGGAADLFNGDAWPLADSSINIWGTSGPVSAGKTYYIAKAWCFGTSLQPIPLAQDGKGADSTRTPANSTGGIKCNGAVNINNAAQTDTFLADVEFYAEQARNNPNFRCNPNPVLIETVKVPSADLDGVSSVNSLISGKKYQFKVKGYWSNAGGRELADAENISYDNWATRMDGDPAWDASYSITGYRDLLDLQVNNSFVDWIFAGTANNYLYDFVGNGNAVNFRVFDGNPALNPVINPGWYTDNSGNLTVEIYAI